uniref:Protein NDNF n=1 Tax=Cacopsylla melanoneura TaxID=428564 RepID=A0A8D8YVR3_9HEMI
MTLMAWETMIYYLAVLALLNNRCVPVFRFYVLIHSDVSLLTISLTTCSVPIEWKVFQIAAGHLAKSEDQRLTTHITTESHTYSIQDAVMGLYTVHVKARNSTWIEWFVNSYQQDAIYPYGNLWTPLTIHKHRRSRKVTVRWSTSVLDPHKMQYIIIINTKKNYTSLCQMQTPSDLLINSPSMYDSPYLSKLWEIPDPSRVNGDTKIKCVGNRTSHTYYNLEQGQDYYISLFARYYNITTNITFLYGSTHIKYDHRHKPIGMRDGKPQVLNLRKHDGKVTLRYKVLHKNLPGPLDWYILSCGGIVTVEVKVRKQVIIAPQQVSSFRHLTIHDPIPGQRYVVHITALDRDELNKINAIEVLTTMHSRAMDTFPDLPLNTKVKEYTSLRECDSVYVGWFPGPITSNMVRYCIKATELPKRIAWNITTFDSKPNQCGLDARLKKSSKEYSTTQCLYVTPHSASFKKELKQKVTNLRPGREYIIQVTMKKTRSRSLSYDLVRVSTVPSCVN